MRTADPSGDLPQEEGEEGPSAGKDAAADSLARARAVARGKGLRPGSRPARRRTKDLPRDARRKDSGRDFTTLGDQVRHLIDERGWDVDVAAGSVMGRWTQIVGPEVAAHSEPVHFELGVLTVRADSTSWATQLRLLSSTLMGRLAQEAGEGVVTELRVVGPSTRSWVRGPRKVSDGRGPRDTYG
jgi:predicted nucleic acid-binding Zn ribbon protein